MIEQDWLTTLDPGIRRFVEILDAHGVETFESCQGGAGHAMAEPTIRFSGELPAGFHALSVALQNGPLPVKAIRRYWSIDRRSGEPDGPHWEMTFWDINHPAPQPCPCGEPIVGPPCTPARPCPYAEDRP